MDFVNFLMALSPIVVVLVGILGFKKSAKTVSPAALLWTLFLAFTYFNLGGTTFAENVKVLDPLVWMPFQTSGSSTLTFSANVVPPRLK